MFVEARVGMPSIDHTELLCTPGLDAQADLLRFEYLGR